MALLPLQFLQLLHDLADRQAGRRSGHGRTARLVRGKRRRQAVCANVRSLSARHGQPLIQLTLCDLLVPRPLVATYSGWQRDNCGRFRGAT